jgi:hypothetical protein
MDLKHPKIRMPRLPDYRRVQLENRSSRQAQSSVATFFCKDIDIDNKEKPGFWLCNPETQPKKRNRVSDKCVYAKVVY